MQLNEIRLILTIRINIIFNYYIIVENIIFILKILYLYEYKQPQNC